MYVELFSLFTFDAAVIKSTSLNEFSIPNFFFGLSANRADNLCFLVYS